MPKEKRPYAHIRDNPREAERVLSFLFPDIYVRNMAIKILVDAVEIANRVAPASWGISLFPNRLCLNVGRGATLQFYPGEILFIVTGQVFNKIPREERSSFRITQQYKFVPDSIEGWLSSTKLNQYDTYRSAHVDLIERAAQNRKICFWLKSHSSGVVKYLRQKGYGNMPSPSYSGASDQDVTKPIKVIDLDTIERETTEGRRALKSHIIRERNSNLIRRKKESVLRANQRLSCEVCGFDFEKMYGSIGHGFAEAHHLKPLASSSGPRLISLSDLAIVCSNCHRMLHRGNPFFSLEELRTRMNEVQRDS